MPNTICGASQPFLQVGAKIDGGESGALGSADVEAVLQLHAAECIPATGVGLEEEEGVKAWLAKIVEDKDEGDAIR